MSGFFGKGTMLDPLGVTTSKYGDPLGINRKIEGKLDKVDPMAKFRDKHPTIFDPLALSTQGAEAKGMVASSQASQQLLGD